MTMAPVQTGVQLELHVYVRDDAISGRNDKVECVLRKPVCSECKFYIGASDFGKIRANYLVNYDLTKSP